MEHATQILFDALVLILEDFKNKTGLSRPIGSISLPEHFNTTSWDAVSFALARTHPKLSDESVRLRRSWLITSLPSTPERCLMHYSRSAAWKPGFILIVDRFLDRIGVALLYDSVAGALLEDFEIVRGNGTNLRRAIASQLRVYEDQISAIFLTGDYFEPYFNAAREAIGATSPELLPLIQAPPSEEHSMAATGAACVALISKLQPEVLDKPYGGPSLAMPNHDEL